MDDAPGDHTKCIIESMNFLPNLSIAASRDPTSNQFKKERFELLLPKDIDREFCDILQWCLFILTRGLPDKYKPKVEIPPSFQKEINDPVGPGQFVIDRYVASCDSQNQNRGAGIPALENVIDYVFNKLGVFDVFEAFKGDKKIEYLQFVVCNKKNNYTWRFIIVLRFVVFVCEWVLVVVVFWFFLYLLLFLFWIFWSLHLMHFFRF